METVVDYAHIDRSGFKEGKGVAGLFKFSFDSELLNAFLGQCQVLPQYGVVLYVGDRSG